ncbi:MAG TPA: Y-family DNA polymerase [Candidatus Saccharimonadales bacterium]|jgi:DNA polymerase V|nr:Y-family DNA polymerase [Candidatus Saccharimonadales bacterium]
MNAVFALIDCNNFFVSCERLFRPDLEGRPVVVLSSNDGCAISRSAEAKDLGIPMGAPAFKYRQLFKDQNVVQFSANFELYGDISERLTRLLTSVTPRTEVYSVDESFLDLSRLEISDYTTWGSQLRDRILTEVGIPVSIGIAATKTLAKLANHRAKKMPELDGILDLISLLAPEREKYLLRTPIDEIWGIGWRLTPKLRAESIFTALDVANLRPRYAAQLMGVHGRQLVAELNGLACHPLELFGKVRQTVMNGRMFGEDTDQFIVIESAIASLTARAAYSLRRDSLLAGGAAISLSTSRHKPGYQRQNRSLKLLTPTADTGCLTAKLVELAEGTFNSQAAYHRANVYLYDLVDQNSLQPDLFGEVNVETVQRDQARLAAVDTVNHRYGKRTLYFAAEDLSNRWEPKHRRRSPRYTTSWEELPTARPSL